MNYIFISSPFDVSPIYIAPIRSFGYISPKSFPTFSMVHLETTASSSSLMSSSGSQHGPSGCPRVEEQLAVAKTIILQAVDLVDKHLTSDEQLTVNSKHLPGSTIGIPNSNA